MANILYFLFVEFLIYCTFLYLHPLRAEYLCIPADNRGYYIYVLHGVVV